MLGTVVDGGPDRALESPIAGSTPMESPGERGRLRLAAPESAIPNGGTEIEPLIRQKADEAAHHLIAALVVRDAQGHGREQDGGPDAEV